MSLDLNDGGRWGPLLEGEAKDRADEAVDAIARDIVDASAMPLIGPSLARGKAGIALMHAYLSRSRAEGSHQAVARRFLSDAIEAPSADAALDQSLYLGSTGIAWASTHLRSLLPEAEAVPDPCPDVDASLLERLTGSVWDGEYELIYGLAGTGVYALERLPDPVALELLERVLALLEERAEWTSEGAAWPTPPGSILVQEGEWQPGFYNLGVAHGIPGVIGFLAALVAADVADTRAERLLDGAVGWLLAQELPLESASSRFPSSLGPEGGSPPPRTAWCYGDGGIAAVLLSAARAAGRADWERKALELARAVAERPPNDTSVEDAGLCHGAAGLGHLLNRLYQATGDDVLASASRSWFERALMMREPGLGVGGFTALAFRNGREVRGLARGFLIGGAGIALALLAATTPVEPGWDRILGVSLATTD